MKANTFLKLNIAKLLIKWYESILLSCLLIVENFRSSLKLYLIIKYILIWTFQSNVVDSIEMHNNCLKG